MGMPSLPASMRKPCRRPAAVVRAAVVLIAVEPPLGLASTVGNPTSFPSRSQLDNSCKCRHPIRKDACYEPVCPEGYFKCCATCELSTCASQGALYSYRGVRECVQCLPGDFCDGCDSFQSCPTVTREGKDATSELREASGWTGRRLRREQHLTSITGSRQNLAAGLQDGRGLPYLLRGGRTRPSALGLHYGVFTRVQQVLPGAVHARL